MMKKNRIAVILFILSGLLALSVIPYSAAINRIMLDRNADVTLAEDNKAVLKLTGFHNESYDMNSTYKSFGSITNNTGHTIKLIVTVIPDFQIYHMFSGLGLSIGNKDCEFRYSSASPKQITLTMPSGQTIEAKAYFINYLFYPMLVEFQFNASDTAGTFTITIANTQSTPRCINLY